MLSAGKHAARKLKRAQILLAADVGSSDEQIARTVVVGGSTVYRTFEMQIGRVSQLELGRDCPQHLAHARIVCPQIHGIRMPPNLRLRPTRSDVTAKQECNNGEPNPPALNGRDENCSYKS